MHCCDCCGKERRDVAAMGRDENGDPDAPDVCFICRVESERGRVYDYKQQRYVYRGELERDDEY